MVRQRIKIKKLDNLSERRVTFNKRRKGLLKKATELSVLCDAEVAVIVLSSTGNLYEYSSSSMNEILEKHYLHSYNIVKLEQPSLELQLAAPVSFSNLINEVTKSSGVLREMMGEQIKDLTLEELHKLEIILKKGLANVKKKNDELMRKELDELRKEGWKLMTENDQLMKLVGFAREIEDQR